MQTLEPRADNFLTITKTTLSPLVFISITNFTCHILTSEKLYSWEIFLYLFIANEQKEKSVFY